MTVKLTHCIGDYPVVHPLYGHPLLCPCDGHELPEYSNSTCRALWNSNNKSVYF